MAQVEQIADARFVAQGRIFLTQTAEPAQQMGVAAELRGPVEVWEGSMQIAEEAVGRRSVLAHGGGPQSHGKRLDMNFQDLIETGTAQTHGIGRVLNEVRFWTARAYSRQTS